jgi:hypothetical protein
MKSNGKKEKKTGSSIIVSCNSDKSFFTNNDAKCGNG